MRVFGVVLRLLLIAVCVGSLLFGVETENWLCLSTGGLVLLLVVIEMELTAYARDNRLSDEDLAAFRERYCKNDEKP